MIGDPRTTAVTSGEIRELQPEFPGIENDYLKFLNEIGWGDVGGMMIFSGPVEATEILPQLQAFVREIVLFGDNWQGDYFGFDKKTGYRLAKITSEGELKEIAGDFITFIEDYVN